MATRVAIDPNVRVAGNQTFAGFEDVTGSLAMGADVEVYESESGLTGAGRVTRIDVEKQLVYVEVDWPTLRHVCTCDHHPDDICLNGVIYESCSSEYCYGACSDEGRVCLGGPGCCNTRRNQT